MKRRRILIVAGFVAAAGLGIGSLALLLKDFVREAIVVPLSYTFAGARDVVERLPQSLLWIVFIVVMALIAMGIVLMTTQFTRRFRQPRREHRGRVEKWLRWIEMSADTSAQYSWQYLALRLRDLLLGVLADRELLTREETEQRLRAGEIDLPPAIRAQVGTLLAADSTQRYAENGDGKKPDANGHGIDFIQIVQYLEDQLEVRRDG